MDALGTASSSPAGAGIQSYLTSMTSNTDIGRASAAAVKSYLDDLSLGGASAPSAPVVKKLLDSVSAGATPTGPGIASYLSSLPATNIHAGGAGIGSYLSSVPVNSVRMGGAGIGSYLDSINAACEASRK